MLIFDQLKKNDPHLRMVTWGVLLGVLMLLAGLWWVQVFSYRHYSENQKAQSFRTVRIPPVRGRILARNGVALAENQPSFNLSLYLSEIRAQFLFQYTNQVLPAWRRAHPGKNRPHGVESADQQRLARYLAASNVVQSLNRVMQEPLQLDWKEFHRHYRSQLALPLPILENMTPEQVARFHERFVNPPGVDIDLQPVRYYPNGSLAAHILGYLTYDDSSVEGEESFFNFRLPDYRGKVGIEAQFDPELHGRAGVKSVLVNSLGYRQSETTWEESLPGRNVVLTIDHTIQRAAEEALNAVASNTRGAVVVMDPNTGDILALVSTPAFDPNHFIPRITHAEYARLTDPKLRPQINRAMQENFAPGSIFKVVTAMAALEEGLHPAQTFFVQPDPDNPAKGAIFIGRRKIKDTAEPGEYNFRRAFIKSSNCYFITNGLDAGAEAIAKIGHRLHFGEKTGLLPGQETPGYFPSLATVKSSAWRDGDTANLCIGQGAISITPLQIAVMISAVANGGKVLWPRLVERIEPQEAGTEPPIVFPHRPVRDNLGVKERTLKIVREAMAADVEDEGGTGRGAAVPGMRVCAKTGTAQVTDPQNRIIDHTTWFASFAPYENPRYAVVVMVESGTSGGGTCAPVARKIYEALLKMEAAKSGLAQK
jgi:penicillin-binding protein 2